ncbi:cathepsin B [Sarracenia purpurea var. burkii]
MGDPFVSKIACLTVLVLWILCTCSEGQKPPKNDFDPITKRHEEWLKTYSRQYKNKGEWKRRFEIYRSNVQFIDSSIPKASRSNTTTTYLQT